MEGQSFRTIAKNLPNELSIRPCCIWTFFGIRINNTISNEGKEKINSLLAKPFNPYVRRHSALTEKSIKLKSNILNQHAGWSKNRKCNIKRFTRTSAQARGLCRGNRNEGRKLLNARDS
jgi:hypothetical protein